MLSWLFWDITITDLMAAINTKLKTAFKTCFKNVISTLTSSSRRGRTQTCRSSSVVAGGCHSPGFGLHQTHRAPGRCHTPLNQTWPGKEPDSRERSEKGIKISGSFQVTVYWVWNLKQTWITSHNALKNIYIFFNLSVETGSSVVWLHVTCTGSHLLISSFNQ